MSKIAKKMILVIISCGIFIATVGILLSYMQISSFLPVFLGTIFGVAISIIKVVMIDGAVNRITGLETQTVSAYVHLQHILRFGITGVLLVVAALVPFINIYSTAAGVLSFQVASLSVRNSASMQ
ncbi:MAG: hypothetical protein FWG88_03295 [Oscillospiraceae bacterium]|nr:hypothetical protein [Oscillospiraceae bacterium]